MNFERLFSPARLDRLPSPLLEPEEVWIREETETVLGAVMRTIPVNERWVVEQRAAGRTLLDCATELGISRQRVAELYLRAMRRLRHPVRLRALRGVLFGETPKWRDGE